jgi:hypothetical protein
MLVAMVTDVLAGRTNIATCKIKIVRHEFGDYEGDHKIDRNPREILNTMICHSRDFCRATKNGRGFPAASVISGMIDQMVQSRKTFDRGTHCCRAQTDRGSTCCACWDYSVELTYVE